MNLKQMRAFKELMLTGSVSEAARNLNRTQPSISHLIAALEDSLGMALFERRGGRLHPVPEAQYLFEECEDLLRRVNTISQNMKRIKAMERGELRIVSMPGPSVFLLPELLSVHVGGQPEVNVTLLSRSSDAVLQLVGSQQFDLGVADLQGEAITETPLIRAEAFAFDCLCALSADDPLASRGRVTAGDLSGRPLACLYPEHDSFGRTQRAFEASGAAMKVRFVTQYFIPLLTYVEKGMACAIVDPLTVESHRLWQGARGGVVFLPFEPAVRFGVTILTPAYRPASVLSKAFLERLRQELARLGGRRIAP